MLVSRIVDGKNWLNAKVEDTKEKIKGTKKTKKEA